MAKKVTDIDSATDIFLSCSICLSDIPKDVIYTSKGGKKYVRFSISKLKELGKFGDTHYLKYSASQEDKARGQYDIFIGGGTEYQRVEGADAEVGSTKKQNKPNIQTTEPADDLPW